MLISQKNETCVICGWIDNVYQNTHPQSIDGPNKICLEEYCSVPLRDLLHPSQDQLSLAIVDPSLYMPSNSKQLQKLFLLLLVTILINVLCFLCTYSLSDSLGFESKAVKEAGRPIYLDMQATSPTDPRVLDAMLPYMTDLYGNPHSRTHQYGWETEKAVEQAREVCHFLFELQFYLLYVYV